MRRSYTGPRFRLRTLLIGVAISAVVLTICMWKMRYWEAVARREEAIARKTDAARQRKLLIRREYEAMARREARVQAEMAERERRGEEESRRLRELREHPDDGMIIPIPPSRPKRSSRADDWA